MNLFVNDIPVRILKPGTKPEEGSFNHVIDAKNEVVSKAKLIHHVWITNVAIEDIQIILYLLNSKVPTNLLSLEITTDHYEEVKNFVKSQFKVVKAAGGLIRKKDKFLMIYRLKKWDLPKGKKESGERYPQTAIREVEEECNISVKLGKKICTTWHTYTMNKRNMIKHTKWYEMTLVDDSKMEPRIEEDIEDLRWMTQKDIYHALENSYKSIRFVFEQYYKKTEDLEIKSDG
ncbi:MAG TPA: NUDIX domain-containing protein [Bacteroidia bacterium]|nr:NUDIX domain-containing protein [Bacteroidia bacterium]